MFAGLSIEASSRLSNHIAPASTSRVPAQKKYTLSKIIACPRLQEIASKQLPFSKTFQGRGGGGKHAPRPPQFGGAECPKTHAACATCSTNDLLYCNQTATLNCGDNPGVCGSRCMIRGQLVQTKTMPPVSSMKLSSFG